jgi:hypothetical protein
MGKLKLDANRQAVRSDTMTLYAFEGASGRSYDYGLLNQKSRAAFPMSAGSYVFVHQAGSVLKIICAGETESIWNVFVSTHLWETAKNQYGATAAYIHLNPDPTARRMEISDLVKRHEPPMNAPVPVQNAS